MSSAAAPAARPRRQPRPGAADPGPGTRGRRRPARAVAAAVVVLGLLTGSAVALAAGTLVRGGPTATASLRLVPAPGNAFSQRTLDPLTDLATDGQSVRSDPVVQDVSQDTGIDPEQLRDRTSVRVVPNSEVLDVTYRAAPGESPTQVASALAQRYLQLRGVRAGQVLDARRTALLPRVQAAQVELADAVAAGADPAETRILSRRLAVLRGELRSLAAPTSDGASATGTLIRVTQEAGRAGLARIALGAGGALVGGGLAWLAVRGRRSAAGRRAGASTPAGRRRRPRSP